MYCYRWLLLLGMAGGLSLVPLPRVLAADVGGAHLESPSEGSFESGIGLIRGWVCDAATVEVEIDGEKRWPTAYGTQRGDTAAVCGDTDNGFGLTFNWNLFGGGLYSLGARNRDRAGGVPGVADGPPHSSAERGRPARE